MEGWGRSGVTDGQLKITYFFLNTYVKKLLIASLGKETENKKSDATLSAKVNFSQVREKGAGNDVVITIVFGVIQPYNSRRVKSSMCKTFPFIIKQQIQIYTSVLRKEPSNAHILVLHQLSYTTGSKNSRHFFIQSEVKPEPIATLSHTFSRALRHLRVNYEVWLVHRIFCVLSDWLALWLWCWFSETR